MTIIRVLLLLTAFAVTLFRPTWGLYSYALLIPGLSLAHVELSTVGTLSGAITLAVEVALIIHVLMHTVKLKISPITWPFVAFIGANLVGFFRSGQGLMPLALSVHYFVLHLLAYSTLPNEKSAQRLLSLFAIVTVALSALGISSYLIGWPHWGMTAAFRVAGGGIVKRLQGPAADPNAFAYIFLAGLPLVIAQIVVARGWLWRLMWIIGLCVGLTGLALTFSRSAYIGFAVSCIVLFWMAGRRMKWRYLSIAVLAAVVLVIFFPGPWKTWMAERVTSVGKLSGDVARAQQFQGAWLTFLDHPFLGVGLGRAQEAVLHYIPKAIAPYPHNDILMTSVEMGLLGLVPLLIIFYRAVVIPLRAAFRSEGLLRNSLAGVAAALCGFFIQGFFIYNMNWAILWFIIATGFSMSALAREAGPNKRYSVRGQ